MDVDDADDQKQPQPLLLAYVDEVKPTKEYRYYLLGAVVADASLVWRLEHQLNALSEKTFGTRDLKKETEFHAAHIWNGKAHYKGWDFSRRIELIIELVRIFGGVAKELDKILVTIDLEKIKRDNVDHERYALMYLIEKVNDYLTSKKAPGLLIGDRENEELAGKNAESLSRYRNNGTDLHFGKSITHLLDTAHFTHSHHSRMLQIADLHTWLRQFIHHGDQGKAHRKAVIDCVREFDDCLFLSKYKDWPTHMSWTR